MGPSQHLERRPVWQASDPRRPRVRRCLLKGCEKEFVPQHPLSRYCSPACLAAARRWSQRDANQRYRTSEGGRRCRREQSCRYRRRVRDRETCTAAASVAACEGYHQELGQKEFCCQRPGCYEQFCRQPRSPLQKFCSLLCRQALRRVLIREARWRRYFVGRANAASPGPNPGLVCRSLSDAYFRPPRR